MFSPLTLVSPRHPKARGQRRNWIRAKIFRGSKKAYHRREGNDPENPACVDPTCPHPPHAEFYKTDPNNPNGGAAPISPPTGHAAAIQFTPEGFSVFLDEMQRRGLPVAGFTPTNMSTVGLPVASLAPTTFSTLDLSLPGRRPVSL
ncbi:hypothetical protein LTR85_001720 [Meristemomyces frigidus]|nr:hypothetical protein LTR85_001720 [Meristemomyces frigidus]